MSASNDTLTATLVREDWEHLEFLLRLRSEELRRTSTALAETGLKFAASNKKLAAEAQYQLQFILEERSYTQALESILHGILNRRPDGKDPAE